MIFRRWIAPLAAAALLVGFVQPATAAAGQLVDLKVLVLSATGEEPSYQAWTEALRREGVPFETIVANTAPPIDATSLEVDANHARYQGIVMATGGLIFCDASGCASALAPEEWAAIEDFERTFGIRQVDAYTFPGPSYGVDWPHGSGDLGGTTATLTAEGAAAFPYLAGPVPIDVGAYGYRPRRSATRTSGRSSKRPMGQPSWASTRRPTGARCSSRRSTATRR